MKTVAIVGGGFSGTMTAVNVARLSEEPVRIVIINANRPLARGTAYGTKRNEHILNVVARNMSAFPDFPSHFVDWLRSRSEYRESTDRELREMFAPRRVYGDYLRSLLGQYLNSVNPREQAEVCAIEASATDIEIDPISDRATIHMDNGDTVTADRVVLATGNQPPGAFPSDAPLRHDPRYRSDPWDDWISRLPPPGGRIVLLGTGLTAVDIVLTLSELGWDGEIIAVSRNGMLPKSHFRGIAYEDYLPEGADTLGLEKLRGLVGEHCERLKQMSQNSAIAIDKLRPHTQRLWAALTTDEKKRFLKEDAALWNVTRHRIASTIHNRITDALDAGRLRVVAGTIQKLVPGEQDIEVVLLDKNNDTHVQSGDLIINCTGPQAHFSQTGLELFDNLLSRGLASSDELDMGLRVNDDFAIVDANGLTSHIIYAIGPLLKGSLWETTAVPELRVQAMRIAETLLERQPVTVESEDVIEYYI